MTYVLRVVISLFAIALPIKLTAWTCICGRTEEGENRVISNICRNFRESHLSGEFHSYVYIPFYHLGDHGEVDWWIDVRHKQSASGDFYLLYELVHKRYDPLNRYSACHVFNILNYSEHARAFGEFLFDINWIFHSTVDFESRKLIDDKETLAAANSRLEIIALENTIYERSIKIRELRKDHVQWLKKIRERQKENDELMLKLYDNCLRTHFSLIPNCQKGVLDFFKCEFQKAFDHIAEFVGQLVERKIKSTVDDATVLLCGIIASEVNRYSLAESCLDYVLEKSPSCKEAYFERAVVRLELGDLDRSLEDYLSSGLDVLFLDNQLQYEGQKKIAEGVLSGFNAQRERDETDTALLRNFFTDLIDTKIEDSAKAANPSLNLISAIISCVEDVRQDHFGEVSEMKIPELISLVKNYDDLDDFEKGELIGIVIKKYDVGVFSKICGFQTVDFYRDVKKVGSLLKLADLLKSKTACNEVF